MKRLVHPFLIKYLQYSGDKCPYFNVSDAAVWKTPRYLARAVQAFFTRFFDWSKTPEREGLLLCSACAPTLYKDGKPTKFGKWHGVFERTFLPLGMFKTNNVGNIEHVETGSDDYRKYVIDPPEFILPELSEDDLIERPNGPLF